MIMPTPNLPNTRKPLVYSCSGCSNVAQLCNHLAIKLDRQGIAEMSCIAGVGGHVPGLVKTAKSRWPIVALDGCPMHCVKSSLALHDVTPAIHIDLSKYGYKKRKHVGFNHEDADTAMSRVMEAINNL
jgi:uncharacterized metal-binding protein